MILLLPPLKYRYADPNTKVTAMTRATAVFKKLRSEKGDVSTMMCLGTGLDKTTSCPYFRSKLSFSYHASFALVCSVRNSLKDFSSTYQVRPTSLPKTFPCRARRET